MVRFSLLSLEKPRTCKLLQNVITPHRQIRLGIDAMNKTMNALRFHLVTNFLLWSGHALLLPSGGKVGVVRETSFFEQGSLCNRRDLFQLARHVVTAAVVVQQLPGAARAIDDTAPDRITACVVSAKGSSGNCVSTASVRQLDLYSPPWTFPESMSQAEAMARLKGAIVSTDTSMVIEQEAANYLRVKAPRNFATDQIEFLINPADHVITFRSEQVQGPSDISDLGANRKRLEDLRRKAQVFGVMGQDMYGEGTVTADAAAKEGVLGQLKAFYGLQSGEGFEEDFD